MPGRIGGYPHVAELMRLSIGYFYYLPGSAHPQLIKSRRRGSTVGQFVRPNMVGMGMRHKPMRLPTAHVEREPRAIEEQSVIPMKHIVERAKAADV